MLNRLLTRHAERRRANAHARRLKRRRQVVAEVLEARHPDADVAYAEGHPAVGWTTYKAQEPGGTVAALALPDDWIAATPAGTIADRVELELEPAEAAAA